MKEIKFRELRREEIDLRVGMTNDKGFSLLLYKDARVDANILDETVGQENWTCKFYQVKNTMFCSVGIYNEERKEYLFKDDAGDESNTEAIKGEASDSFKRACFKWGIGRALYTSPFVWITKDETNDPKKSHYSVEEIDYQNGKITKLFIKNDKTGQVVFTYGGKGKSALNEPKTTKESHSNFDNKHSVTMKELNASVKSMEDYENEYNDPLSDNSDMAYVKEYYNKLSEERKQKFEIWLFTTVQETKVEKLNNNQAKTIADLLRKQVAKDLEKKASDR